jgi:hypothetical protein
MKKSIFLLVLVFTVAEFSNAQIRFGIKAGANMTSFSTKENIVEQVKGATNYQFGILFNAKMGMLSLQPEVLYSVKGSELTDAAFSEYTGNTVKFNSQNIEVPVNLQLGINLGKKLRAYVQAGPYFSYMTGGTTDTGEDFNDFVENFNLNRVDYGVGFGAGVELFGLQVAARYDLGFNPIGMTLEEMSAQNPFSDLRNRSINLSVALLF